MTTRTNGVDIDAVHKNKPERKKRTALTTAQEFKLITWLQQNTQHFDGMGDDYVGNQASATLGFTVNGNQVARICKEMLIPRKKRKAGPKSGGLRVTTDDMRALTATMVHLIQSTANIKHPVWSSLRALAERYDIDI